MALSVTDLMSRIIASEVEDIRTSLASKNVTTESLLRIDKQLTVEKGHFVWAKAQFQASKYLLTYQLLVHFDSSLPLILCISLWHRSSASAQDPRWTTTCIYDIKKATELCPSGR